MGCLSTRSAVGVVSGVAAKDVISDGPRVAGSLCGVRGGRLVTRSGL